LPAQNDGLVAVAAGLGNSFALRSDGSIAAWGQNYYGNQTTVPEPNSDFAAIAMTGFHVLALKNDGSIVSWGNNDYGQCDVPQPNTGFTAIAAGAYHSLALRADGTIVAWGRNTFGQCDVPSPNGDFAAIAAGWGHSLGLKRNGFIAAWGRNESNQCAVPDPNADFVAIAASGSGNSHSVGLKRDGTIAAWGDNYYGQCNLPSPNTGFVAIATGGYHTLALRTNGSIAAFGMNDFGQCNVPTPNVGFLSLAAGDRHSIGIRSGNAIPDGFVLVPPGTFSMGSPTDEPERAPNESQHQVTLTHDLYVQSTEVTNQQYVELAQWAYDRGYVTATTGALYDKLDGSTQLLKSLGGSNHEITFSAGIFSCINPTHPVKYVTWYGAVAYCDWLNLQRGSPRAYDHNTWECNAGSSYTALGFRLPTEAEWEYVCRAGMQTPFNTGACLDAGTEANYDGRDPFPGCTVGPYVGWTVPAAGGPANAYGLHEMHGNEWEWCNDWYGAYGGAVTDPVGPVAGSYRIARGGGWDNSAGSCRSACRNYVSPADAGYKLGFRPVRTSGEVQVGVPMPIAPSDREIFNRNSTSSIVFSWVAVPNAIEYRLNVYGAGQPSSPKYFGIVKSTSQPVAVDYTWEPNTYEWEVQARTSEGWGAYSSSTYPREIIVDIPASRPALIAPANSSVCQIASQQSFTWSPVYEAARYYLRLVSGTDLNSTPLVSVELTERSYSTLLDSADYTPGIYTWGVRAIKAPPQGYDGLLYEATLGWGAYSTRQITLQTPVVAEFTIASVGANQSCYQNGADTVNMSLDLRNNSGPSSANIAVYFCPNVGPRQLSYSGIMTIAPGSTSSLQYSCPMPDPGYAAEYSVSVEYGTVTSTFPAVFTGTEMTAEEVTTAYSQVDPCLAPALSCANSLLGIIPWLGTGTDMIDIENAACEATAAILANDNGRAAVAVGMGALTGVEIVLESNPATALYSMIPAAITGTVDCTEALIDIFGDKAYLSVADTLMAATMQVFDASNKDYSNEAIVVGPGTLRIEIAEHYTSTDTLQLTSACVLSLPSIAAEWAHVGSGSVPLERQGTPNAANAMRHVIYGNGNGQIDYSLLHRNDQGIVAHLQYPPFEVQEATVCVIALADTTRDFGIRIDYDGDGSTDRIQYPYPSAAVIAADSPVSAYGLWPAYPNPFNGMTTIAFDVPKAELVKISIFNLAGRRVRSLLHESRPAGRNVVGWDGMDDGGRTLPSGTYFFRMEAGAFLETRRTTLLK
jgi:formylglycine-generating enzyme required for sulfatase activity/alpha-tubulin suppressor-like RCC1 family protein